ncbi:MAG: Maltose operon transcriptional repressor MalR, LacI family [uncultured Rubrobacteraceae bacterium]|uniref:Maltose operon transcriptional repressor MalR, LacI family n=1 Tax=uncultured Rubrobacteraceae bacterium TaxID=349277 RepID=A0A6J4QPU6_9ACTN|nr:MAG: Maltose operon transcriptional repressor MalR, LacI family [uncultured Rubrobacteraceae bacterium]
MGTVTRRAGGPMYQQLRQDLLGRIRRGEYSAGDLLPSESALCEQYGVSVTTARRALLELVKEGAVYRKAGVGTMVASGVRRVRLAFLSIDYKGDAWRRTPSAMGEIVAGLGEECWQRAAAFSMTGVERDGAATHLRGLVEERSVDGVLLRTADDIDEELLEILEGAGMPYVVVKRRVPDRKINCVISDDVTGARIATSHLLDLGHTRIAFVCAKAHLTLGQERLAGYRAALAERGVEFEPALVRQRPNFTTEEGYGAVRELLDVPSPPGAVFVASDTMALGAYGAVRDLGMEVPRDVSLVGYDDISPVAVLQPPLTTIRTSYYDFGRLAAELILDIIEGREVAPAQRTIEPLLIVRNSTLDAGSGTGLPASLARSARPEPDRPPTSRGGMLAGKTAVVSGSAGETITEVARFCEAEGATVAAVGGARADAFFYCFRPGPDLGAALDRALTDVRELSEGGLPLPDSIVYVVPTGLDADAPIFAAVRAGVARLLGSLAGKEGSRGMRVNAVLLAAGKPEGAARSAVFLAAEETVGGEVLVLRGTTGRPARS